MFATHRLEPHALTFQNDWLDLHHLKLMAVLSF